MNAKKKFFVSCWPLLVIAGLLMGCSNRVASTDTIDLVDPDRPLAVAGQPGWEYQRVAVADVDSDGKDEQVYIIANAPVTAGGEPLWDDGQVWQAYIEEPSGERTYIFSRFIQLGTLEGMLAERASESGFDILLVQKTFMHLGIYSVQYQSPGTTRTTVLLDQNVYQHVSDIPISQ
jgi:hypothetical protein